MSKARNLALLAASGVCVPRGFTLPAACYQVALDSLFPRIASALGNPVEIEAIFRAAGIPDSTRQILADNLANLSSVSRFAVRSSGSVVRDGRSIQEDSVGMALAGQFESYLNVPRDLVPSAVLRCWASLFNERSTVAFSANLDYVMGSTMSVVIQEMIPGKASAVMMTCDPTGNGDTGAIEFTWGPCEAIVSGIVNPDEATFHRKSRDIVSSRIGSKSWRISYTDFSEFNSNSLKTPTPPEDRVRLSLPTVVIQELIELGARIEQLFDCPQDVEIVVTPEDRVIVTQSRPITTLPTSVIPFLKH